MTLTAPSAFIRWSGFATGLRISRGRESFIQLMLPALEVRVHGDPGTVQVRFALFRHLPHISFPSGSCIGKLGVAEFNCGTARSANGSEGSGLGLTRLRLKKQGHEYLRVSMFHRWLSPVAEIESPIY
jgi:hypothetical protein